MPAKRFGIDQFKATMSDKGLATTSQFMVEMPLWPNAPSNNYDAGRMLQFAAFHAELPSLTFNTMEARRFGIGPIFSYPTTVAHADSQMILYTDQRGIIIDHFQQWVRDVVNFDTGDEGGGTAPASDKFTLNYKSEYVVNIKIHLFQRANNQYYEYTLNKAWPFAIGQAQLDWQSTELLRLPVTFRYESYSVKRLDTGAVTLNNLLTNPHDVVESLGRDALGSLGILKETQQISDIVRQVNTTGNILKTIF